MRLAYYELSVRSNKRLSLIPHDLRYFRDHFNCTRMADRWSTPPFKVHGKSYSLPDFVGWMLCAPLVSQRAKDAISTIVDDDLVEFLPFDRFKGKDFYALNVISTDTSGVIFKKAPDSLIYVTRSFGEMAIDFGITGLIMADPFANNGRKIVQGEELNMFPGLLT